MLLSKWLSGKLLILLRWFCYEEKDDYLYWLLYPLFGISFFRKLKLPLLEIPSPSFYF